MTVLEFDKKIDTIIRKIRTDLPEAFASMIGGGTKMVGSLDMLAILKRRIQDEGKDSKGNPWKKYSTKPMLIGYPKTGGTSVAKIVYKKLAGSKTKRRDLKWVTVKGRKLFELSGGYLEAKKIFAPEQGGKVDFTVKGDMMRSIGVVNKSSNENIITVTVGARNDLEKKKLEGNEKKRPGILLPSDSEIKKVEKTLSLYIENLFNEYLNK